MIRLGPLVAIVVVVVMIGATLGTTFLWVVTGISVIALGVLMVVMFRNNQFSGPKVLIDDARDRFDRMGRDEPDEAVVVDVRRNESESGE